jgi:Na+/proline symporter
MTIIFAGMGLAAVLLFRMLPEQFSFTDIVSITGKTGKLNIVDFKFDPSNRYNIWSGLIGGFFLAMSYFGTDQSQVGRYLTGKSITEIRLGLLLNGIVKIPMQLFILFIGALLYVFYIFNPQPLFFNKVETAKVLSSPLAEEYRHLERLFSNVQEKRKSYTMEYAEGIRSGDEDQANAAVVKLRAAEKESQVIRQQAHGFMLKNDPRADVNDTNYVFLKFVTDYLPEGIIGLLIAVIFAASMSSTSSELNALASTTVVDIYKRSVKPNAGDRHYVNVSRWATVFWGIYAIGVAEFANRMGSLIEAVNILGSLFYGTILGIFLSGFYLKKTNANAVFYSAIIAEEVVVWCFTYSSISFLWYNVIGCLLVMGLSLAGSYIVKGESLK